MTRQAQRPTLRDVGAAANVSIYTASRALGGFPDVAPATRSLVHASAKAIGYRPNRVARSLRHSVSHTIGVLTANTANRYYAQLVRSLSKALQLSSYHCFEVDAVEEGGYSQVREHEALASLIEHRVAGIVLTYVPAPESLDMIAAWRMPIVFVDCHAPAPITGVASVTPDNHAASMAVGRHFADLGYRSWLFLGHTASWTSRLDRERGFHEAASRCGARVEVVEGGNASHTASAALRQHLGTRARSSWPRALYASNEPLLNGAIRFLQETGAKVPDEVAVVGFDDFDWSELMTPSITVVDQRIEEIGILAAEQILAAVAGQVPTSHVIQPFLQIRRSCGAGRR